MPRIINLYNQSDEELSELYHTALYKQCEYYNELIELTENQKQVEADLNVTEEQVADGSINQGEYMEAMHDIGQQWQMYKRLIELEQAKIASNQRKIHLCVTVAQRRGLRKPDWEIYLQQRLNDLKDAYDWLMAT
jgi:hypothetical protein